MKTIALAATFATILAAPASAQYQGSQYPGPQYQGPQYQGRGWDRGGPPRAILFGQPGFQGRSVVIDRRVGKLERFGFDDRTSSIKIRGGAWRVCVDDHFGGRCEIIDHSIPDLAMIHMDNRISSIEPVGPGPGY